MVRRFGHTLVLHVISIGGVAFKIPRPHGVRVKHAIQEALKP